MKASMFKFRVWNRERRIMHYTDEFSIYDNCIMAEFQQSHNDDKEAVIMQCTGLSDKTGQEIFEGDIVKQNCVVSYEGNDYCDTLEIDTDSIGEIRILPSRGVCLKPPIIVYDNYEEKELALSNSYINVRSYRCEIIGNIFENPELLEEKK